MEERVGRWIWRKGGHGMEEGSMKEGRGMVVGRGVGLDMKEGRGMEEGKEGEVGRGL